MAHTRLFAEALVALHKAGLLHEPACKPAVKTLIRQATEDKHWHLSAHYRSKNAGKLVQSAQIKTPAQYQAFCRKHLRHEHMVPGAVVYELILASKPTAEAYERILKKTGYRATITHEEDKKLARDSVPKEFYQRGSGSYFDHLIRYKDAKRLDRQLVSRPKEGWLSEC